MRNPLLSAQSLALCQCTDPQSRKAVEGSAKSCRCFLQIKMDLCVYHPWHHPGPPWNPQTPARCLSLRGSFLLGTIRERWSRSQHGSFFLFFKSWRWSGSGFIFTWQLFLAVAICQTWIPFLGHYLNYNSKSVLLCYIMHHNTNMNPPLCLKQKSRWFDKPQKNHYQ